jgi:hypothetical protein
MNSLFAELFSLCIEKYDYAIVYNDEGLIRGAKESSEILQLPEEFMSIINEIRHLDLELPSRGETFRTIMEDRYFQHIQEHCSSGTKSYAIFSLVDRCLNEIQSLKNNGTTINQLDTKPSTSSKITSNWI